MAKAVRFFDQGTTLFDGSSIAAGYYLFQYQAGTSTKANTYTDSGKGTANSNPMTLNSDGRLGQDVYIDQSMKFVLAPTSAGDPPTSSVWTIDNALANEQVFTTTTKTSHYTIVESDRDKAILVDSSGGVVTITLLAAATAGDGFRLIVKKTDSSANAITVDGNGSETIDGATTEILYNQYDSLELLCDGSNWHVKSREMGNLDEGASGALTIAGATTITSGNFTMTSGNAALTSGNLTLTSGNATLTSGNLTLTDGTASISTEDSRTNSVAVPLTVTATTDGTPAASIGTGILFRAESADENPSDFGRLEFVASDVTAGSEDTLLRIRNRRAGAAIDKAYAFVNTGSADSEFVFSGAPTADRTITLPDSDITLGIASAASQAEQETGTATDKAVTPGRQQFHNSACKFWCKFNGTGTIAINDSYNVTSIADDGTGDYTVTIATDFSSADWVFLALAANLNAVDNGQTAGTLAVRTVSSGGTATDAARVHVAGFGDQ